MSEPRIEINVGERDRRLYDRVRSHVIGHRPNEPSRFRDLLLLIPDFVVLMVRLARDSQVPPGVKLVAISTVAYVLSPIELLPELVFGPIGLIDDLLAIGLGVSFLVNRVHPDLVRAHWPGQQDALESVQAISS